ncbi:MAG TPA: hypothetical protein DCO72_05275 [Ruminococcus sp.]|nr:hypothetical protein [Ruminococcus sp.]
MKKLSWVILLAIFLTGCGAETETEISVPDGNIQQETAVAFNIENPAPEPETEPIKESETIDIPLETLENPPAPAVLDFADFDSIPDEKIAELALHDFSTTEFIESYYVPRIDRNYQLKFVPENEDFESYLSNPENFTIETSSNYTIEAVNPYDENDLYSIFEVHYTDDSQGAIEYQLFPKNFRLSGNDYAIYTGGMDEESVLLNFDLISQNQHIIWRNFRDNPEIKCIAYDFYSVTRLDNDTAELGWYCYLIDRDDFMVSLRPEWNLKRNVNLSGLPESVPDDDSQSPNIPDDAEIFTDIQLYASQSEIVIGEDQTNDNEVIWYAKIPVDCNPESVALIDESTGEKVADLYDLADYEKYGDTIQGDSIYNCRFKVNIDIDTNPDVSEDAHYHYYAEFADEKGIHRSEPFQIWVLEQFTDKELNDIEIVDKAVSEMLNSNDFQKLSPEKRVKFAEKRLHELEEQDYIKQGSIRTYELNISFEYSCGISGGMMPYQFDENVD